MNENPYILPKRHAQKHEAAFVYFTLKLMLSILTPLGKKIIEGTASESEKKKEALMRESFEIYAKETERFGVRWEENQTALDNIYFTIWYRKWERIAKDLSPI